MKFLTDLFSESGNTSSRRFLLYIFAFPYIWKFIHDTEKGLLTPYTEEQYVQILMLLIVAVVFDKVPAVISAFKGEKLGDGSPNPPGGDRPKTPPIIP